MSVVILERSSSFLTALMSIPSMTMVPEYGKRPRIARNSDDLPLLKLVDESVFYKKKKKNPATYLPVRPVIPIFFPDSQTQDISSRTRLEPLSTKLLYLILAKRLRFEKLDRKPTGSLLGRF